MNPTSEINPAAPAMQGAPLPMPSLMPHEMALQVGLTLMKGHMFVGQHALYFVPSSSGSAIWSAAGQALGGAVGALVSMGGPKDASGVPGLVAEKAVYEACKASKGTIFMPDRIHVIKQTWLTRYIRYEGRVYGARHGFPKELRQEIGVWATARGIKTKGMK